MDDDGPQAGETARGYNTVMLKIRLRNVIDYANRDHFLMRKAVDEFFGKKIPDPNHESFDEISSLFNEWLIFDFRLDSSRNWLAEYYLKNPDALSQDQMVELKQIIQTQKFGMFEIEKIVRGVFLDVYGLFDGKMYKVWDQALSSNIPGKGSFWNRVAMVDEKWIFVGSNPLFFPITHTPRMRKILLRESGQEKPTAKTVRDLLLADKKAVDPFEGVPKNHDELEKSRKRIQKRYVQLSNRYGFVLPFDEVVAFVFAEKYNHNEADFYTDLIKMGIPEKPFFKHYQLFGDIWNYFPHKRLKGKSPTEIVMSERHKAMTSEKFE